MLLSPRALKALNCIERTQPRILCATFDGNPCQQSSHKWHIGSTIESPTNAIDELEITFYDGLSCLIRHIHKHIGGGINAQIGKDENDKSCLYYLPNRNGEYQINLLL